MKGIFFFFLSVKTSSSFCSRLDNTEQTQACQPFKDDTGHYAYLILFHNLNLN